MPPTASIGDYKERLLQAMAHTGRRYIWVGDLPPDFPKAGDIWFDTSTDALRMYSS